jgi:sterol desaturase/sphingolipid hydroxylase (fatty acid hydroxylase superfamily)
MQMNTAIANKQSKIKMHQLLLCILCTLLPVAFTIFIKTNPLLFYLLLNGAGWLTWTYVEYFFHRFAMHPKKNKSHSAPAKKHQHHHHSPSVLEVNLFHRLLLFIVSCFLVFFAWKLNNYFSIISGFFWGFSAFCYIHYLLHQKWIKYFIPRHHYFHICHHCKFPDTGFGVTVIWWDALFGTMPPEEFKISEKATSLYYL